MAIAEMIVHFAEGWLVVGAATTLVFLGFGLEPVEPAARRSQTFRVLLVPGLMLLWPLVLWRWRKMIADVADPDPHLRAQRQVHALVWMALAVTLPLMMAGALLWPHPQPGGPVQLAPAAGQP